MSIHQKIIDTMLKFEKPLNDLVYREDNTGYYPYGWYRVRETPEDMNFITDMITANKIYDKAFGRLKDDE